MNLKELQPGDMVYAATNITNDGSLPGVPEGELVAAMGSRGVIINVGHLEDNPDKELMLVRFETHDNELGPSIGCWFEELTATPPVPLAN